MAASFPTEPVSARTPALGLLLLLAAGCTTLGGPAPSASGPAAGEPTPRSKPARPVANLAGYNAGYREGHADGCDSARGTPRKSAKRYGGDTDYMMGWNDGHLFCRPR